ncbi:MAG: hypothetical protein CYG59_24545 [Chloroflexi bacterium]|nr:MAG: hypothetical protein CYG59_24545 [Chloroflexota bacterium]
MALHSHPTSQPMTAPKRPAFCQLLSAIRYLSAVLPRAIRRPTIKLQLGLVWRVSATLFVLIQHAERTDCDAETIRQARALYAALQRAQGRTTSIRSMPISSDIPPVA